MGVKTKWSIVVTGFLSVGWFHRHWPTWRTPSRRPADSPTSTSTDIADSTTGTSRWWPGGSTWRCFDLVKSNLQTVDEKFQVWGLERPNFSSLLNFLPNLSLLSLFRPRQYGYASIFSLSQHTVRDAPPWGTWLRTLHWWRNINRDKRNRKKKNKGQDPNPRPTDYEAYALPLCYNRSRTRKLFSHLTICLILLNENKKLA